MTTQPPELKEELRRCFLFESLTDEQLDWLVEHGAVETFDAGVVIYDEGTLAESFYVLLEGEIQLVKRLDGTDVVISTANQPGAYAGATRAFIPSSADQSYASSLRTVTRSRLFKLRGEDFAQVLKTWFPMAVHLLDGLFLGMTNAEALVGQREKLIALGALSAGLAHELNNPAAAEVRAAEALSGQLQEARQAMVKLAPKLTKARAPRAARPSQRGHRTRLGTSPSLSTLEAGDLEDALAEPAFRPPGSKTPWELAPALVSAGWTMPGSTGSSSR